jgi:hypothetical protein
VVAEETAVAERWLEVTDAAASQRPVGGVVRVVSEEYPACRRVESWTVALGKATVVERWLEVADAAE